MAQPGGSLIGVLGGCGGAGTSTFAAVLAATADGVLVDVDAVSGGIDITLGIDAMSGSRWSAVRLGGGRLDPRSLADGLPRWGAARVLAADEEPHSDALSVVLDAARRLGPVVVDLGRATNASARAVALDCDLVLVLALADVPALAAARATVRSIDTPMPGLVLRRGPVRAHDAAELVGLPLIALLPALPRRDERGLDPDRLPRRLVRAAAGIVDGCRR